MKCTRGPYLVKNPLLYLYLKTLDSLCSLLRFFKKHKTLNKPPKKILVIHLAHRGDILLATSILPLLKNHYPTATLSMLIGSWNQEILEDHPLLEKIYFLDHPKTNRSKLSFLRKVILYLTQIKLLTPQITQYDLSVDLYPYYPNSHVVTWLAKIPRRIGYQSGGASALLTEAITWTNKNASIVADFVELLKPLGIFANATTLKSNLAPFSDEVFHDLKKKYKLEKPYLIFHPYSGNPLKDWKDSSWKALTEKSSSHSIIFTGGSTLEKTRIDCLSQDMPNTLTLANQLSFAELKALVSNATALVAVDTMIGHLAAIYDIPSIILYSEMSDPIYWHPLSTKSLAVHQKDATATEVMEKALGC